MLNKDIAKCAASMTWRFFILLMAVGVLFQPFINAYQESLMIPVVVFSCFFLSMYLTLVWMSVTNAKKAEREKSVH